MAAKARSTAGTHADDPFERRAETYELLVDWDKRLANETPFFRELFERVGVRRVLDVACGVGRHAALFHSWGLEVEGADLSAEMLARCRERFGEPAGLTWVQRSFETRPEPPGRFDAVVNLGNSLALAADAAAVERAAAAMGAALRPGGVGVVQVLNLWSVEEGPTTWQKCRHFATADGHRVILKGLHRCGERGHIDVVDLALAGGELAREQRAASFRGISAAEITGAIAAAGGDDVELFGSYQRTPYDVARSVDLIAVFRRGGREA